MGIFAWLFGKRARDEVLNINGPGTFSFDVVGESHYQRQLSDICGGGCEDGYNLAVDAYLIHDDDNKHDSQAIAVVIEGETVGHLFRKDARQFRKAVSDAGHPGLNAMCRAKIVGGWERGGVDRGDFGVRLDMPTR